MTISISWSAPIAPSQSLAGIPLGMRVTEFEEAIKVYAVNVAEGLYQFSGSPILKMIKNLDSDGGGGYGFFVCDLELTNWRLYYDSPSHPGVESRALHVLVRNRKIHAVKAWLYESLARGDKPVSSYQGKLPEGIGLGDLIRDLSTYTDLEFDSAEEWFYTDEKYGGLEVSGYGCDLNDDPDQIITALTVIGSSSSSDSIA